MIGTMSDKESKFMQILTTVLGGFILAIILGIGSFYMVTIQAQAAQEEKNKSYEMRMLNNETKIETVRIEIRQDLKEIKMNVDKIAVEVTEKNNR